MMTTGRCCHTEEPAGHPPHSRPHSLCPLLPFYPAPSGPVARHTLPQLGTPAQLVCRLILQPAGQAHNVFLWTRGAMQVHVHMKRVCVCAVCACSYNKCKSYGLQHSVRWTAGTLVQHLQRARTCLRPCQKLALLQAVTSSRQGQRVR